MSRGLSLLFPVASILLLTAPTIGGGATDDSAAGAAVVSTWAAGVTNGGIRRPVGASSCSSWVPLDHDDPVFGELGADAALVINNPVTGQRQRLYGRVCDGRVQMVWVGDYSAEELAQIAFQEVSTRVPGPVPVFGPPADALVVNLPVWFGATPVAAVTATAQVPGLSSTVSATATALRLETGSRVAGDTKVVACVPWGSSAGSVGGCEWVPAFPSVPKVTGTSDLRYHARLVITWAVTWQASNGRSGDLGTIETATDIALAVREIQTY